MKSIPIGATLRHAKSKIWENSIGPNGGKTKIPVWTGLTKIGNRFWFLTDQLKQSDCLMNFHSQLKISLRYVIVNRVLRYVD